MSRTGRRPCVSLPTTDYIDEEETPIMSSHICDSATAAHRGNALPKRSDLDIIPDHGVDNITHAISIIASSGAVALLPIYPNNLLPWSVTSRPIRGDAPTVDLVVGYNKANRSPILKLFLSRVDDLTSRMSSHAR